MVAMKHHLSEAVARYIEVANGGVANGGLANVRVANLAEAPSIQNSNKHSSEAAARYIGVADDAASRKAIWADASPMQESSSRRLSEAPAHYAEGHVLR